TTALLVLPARSVQLARPVLTEMTVPLVLPAQQAPPARPARPARRTRRSLAQRHFRSPPGHLLADQDHC
ncbi:MAG: hypothetical protein OEV00_13430, partial [Acidobacteriota bacterium]|nr:hypothetical protein [Acidobacteriota bacterium]